MTIDKDFILITPNNSLCQVMYRRYKKSTLFADDENDKYDTLHIVKKYPEEFLYSIANVDLKKSFKLAADLIQAQYARYGGEDAEAIKYYTIEDAFNAIAEYFEEYVDKYSKNFKKSK